MNEIASAMSKLVGPLGPIQQQIDRTRPQKKRNSTELIPPQVFFLETPVVLQVLQPFALQDASGARGALALLDSVGSDSNSKLS